MMHVGYDIIGNIAILKFDFDEKAGAKKKFAHAFLTKHKNITSVLEKTGKFKGRLRTQETKYLAGENTKEALYKENGCFFRLNVDTCYFSPRLSTERKELAAKTKKGECVLVMFGGVAPFGVVIGKHSKAKEIVSVELGRVPSKYAQENVKRNKLENVRIIQGDVRKVVPRLKGKFDRIVMARPNLEDSFLEVAFPAVRKGGIIHYYGFYHETEKEEMVRMIKDAAKKARKKIKILRVKKAIGIGPYKWRYRVDIKLQS